MSLRLACATQFQVNLGYPAGLYLKKDRKKTHISGAFLLAFLMLLLPLPIEPSSPLLFPLACDSGAQMTLVHT